MARRAALLAPSLLLAPEDEANAESIGGLVRAIVHAAFVRHPGVALLDSGSAATDEILAIELDLDGIQPLAARVVARFPDGKPETFRASSGTRLSALLGGALAAWLEARGLERVEIEPFTLDELRATADWAGELIAAGANARALLAPPPTLALAPAFFHLLVEALPALGAELDARALEIDPDDPIALAGAIAGGRSGRAPAELVKLAPCWWRARLLAGDTAGAHELRPADPDVAAAYADALLAAGHAGDALRLARRAAAAEPWCARAHVVAIQACRQTGHRGEALVEALARVQLVDQAGDPALRRRARLTLAECQREAGHLGEAIATARNVLAPGDPEHDRVDAWGSDRRELALAFARDGVLRGDPGRAIEGYARAGALESLDAAAFADALADAGKERLAPIAIAAARAGGPAAWLAEARGLLAWNDLRGAYGLIQRASLASRGHNAEIARTLRLAACRPVAEWEAVVGGRLQVGAIRLARLAARDAADFVPGAGSSQLLRRLVGRVEGELDAKEWLAPLRKALGHSFGDIEAFFQIWRQPSLEHADRLVGEWSATTPAELVYTLAQSLGRYLWMTTQAASPLAGGLRQVALAAMEKLDGTIVDLRWRKALDDALAIAAAHADPWIVDGWLLRVGRALGDAPRDERGQASEATGEAACVAWERCLRSLGPLDVAASWAEAAAQALPAANAIDVMWTAHAAAPADATVGELLAEALESTGHAAAARDVAVETAAPRALARAPAFAEAEAAGLAALAAGDAQAALPALRLCAALEPRNPTVLKNLGIACALGGDVTGCVRALAGVDARSALRLAAQALLQARRYPEAHAVLGVAATAFFTDDEWLLRGGTAWYAGDLRAAADAYATLAALRPLTADEERARATAAAQAAAPTPAERAFRALALGDSAAIKAEAESAPGWGTWRAMLIIGDESTVTFLLEATVGQLDLDACLLRERALRARHTASAAPPLAAPMDRAAFIALFSRRPDADDEPTFVKKVSSSPS